MSSYIIEGGKRLSGSIEVNTAKNSAVACMMAALLVKGKVTLTAMPRIQEVERILEILVSIGVSARWKARKTLELDASGPLNMQAIDRPACTATRSSLLLMGALAAREKQYKLYKSGGCKLGSRTVRPHLLALEKLGMKIESRADYYDVRTKHLAAADIVMYEAGDTPTENAIMAAVLAPGTTTISFCSANYMVQDLCHFLKGAGANIEGIGTTTLTITGVKKLHPVTHAIIPDPIEAMAFIALGATTGSQITVKGAPLDFLALELEKLSVMGQRFSISKKRKSPSGHFQIADITLAGSQLKALPDKLSCQPYPGLNIDNLPLFVPILAKARGRTLVHDWVYDNRAIYALELQKLGAQVQLIDTHRVFIEGPSKLKGAELMCPPALRPGMAILISMLAAKGRSVLRNCYVIERGYENIAERLSTLGARIVREGDTENAEPAAGNKN